MKLYVKMNEVEDEGTKLKKIAKEEMVPLIDEIVTMVNELDWEGTAYESFFVQYIDSAVKLYDISKTVERLGEFYQKASSTWQDTEKKAENDWKEYDEEVEKLINKTKIIRATLDKYKVKYNG